MDSQPDWQRIAIRGFSAIVLAVLANVVLLTIVLEADLVIPFDPLRYPPVVFLTTMGTLGATVVYGFLAARRENPDQLFVRVAGIALILSLLPDIGLLVSDPNATVSAVGILMVMHGVAAAICVGVLTTHWR